MSPLSRRIRTFAWISLGFVYLVILAGSIVRATGSGMGCPDWPRCYGYLIPPTDVEQVTWAAGREFKPGQMIVHGWRDGDGVERDHLLVAKETFRTKETFDAAHWRPYDRHDYAIFNPVHTWIEFINRLLGALTGIPVTILFVLSIVAAVRERAFLPFLWALGAIFTLGFVAWLGKLVVDGNLIPGSITLHMLGSIALIGFLLLLIRRGDASLGRDVRSRALGIAVLAGSLVQVVLGTQVREEVDHLNKSGSLDRGAWTSQLTEMFDVHRSFSWALLGVTLWWVFLLRRRNVRCPEAVLALALVVLQGALGVILSEWAFPAFAQPAHIFGALLLVGVVLSGVLKFSWRRA